jgi:ABC-type transport system substrate-binding protein
MLSRRRLLGSSLALVGGAGLAGCAENASQADRLMTATTDDLPSLDPAQAFDTWSTSVVEACTRRLVDYDAGGKLVGDLAQSWKLTDGRKTYTFDLRPDAKFADGTQITSAHLKSGLDRARDPQTSPNGSGFYGGVEALEVPDAGTFVIRLKAADPTFLRVLGMTFASPWKPGDDPRHPTSSGPYKLKDYIPSSRVVLARNPLDPKSEGWVEEITLQLQVVQPLQWTRVSINELDLLPEIPPSEYDRIMADAAEKAHYVQGVVNQTWYFGMNTTRPPWNNPKVRQAALQALNREKLAGIGGPGALANGILPPHVPGYDPQRKLAAYDPEAARKLLAEAGFPNGAPKSVLWLAENEKFRRKAELIQSDLAAGGIPVELRPVVFSEYKAAYRSKADCWYGGWYPDFADAGNFLEPVFLSSNIGPGKSNAAHYNNPAFDALLNQAHSTPEGPVREGLYKQAEDLLIRDLPWIPLTYEVETRYFRTGVTGVVVHPVWRQMLTGISKR